jgi:hypothetical protein
MDISKMKRALESQLNLDNLLKEALARNHSRLSFDTTYNHKNIFDWFTTFLPDWTIVIPDSSCSAFALSDWPTGITRNCVKEWLQEMNHQTPDDLIDGACEPLAYYLSSSLTEYFPSSETKLRTVVQQKKFISSIYKEVKNCLAKLEPRVAAELIFGEYIKQESPSPQFWPEISDDTFNHFLLGHYLARSRIQEIVASGDSTKTIPLYVLCYLFDENELTDPVLKEVKEETAQYSLHAVGLVINSSNKTIIVADPNGGLKEGSNMEFLSMPLRELESEKATTKVSRYDRDQEAYIKMKESARKRARR